MAINIMLPEMNTDSESTKNLIINILSKEWPLSAKKVHYRIKKIYAINCTYQAIHKQLRLLTKRKVLEKDGKNYRLSIEWLDALKNFSDEIKKDYNKCGVAKKKPEAEEKADLKYFKKYRQSIASLLRTRVRGFPKLDCVRTELGESGQRIEVGKSGSAVKQVLKTGGTSLLLGPSGAGKTTTLTQIGLKACDSSKIPVLFNLANFNECDLDEIIQQKIFEVSGERISTGFIDENLKKGAFVFLFDGLNEITGELYAEKRALDKAEFIINQINHFGSNKNYSKNQFVIACRTNADPKSSLSATTFMLCPFTENQIKKYLLKRGLKNLFEQIAQDNKIFELCKNPLILDMTVNIYNSSKNLFHNKTKMYQEYFTNTIYGWESKNIKKLELIALDLEEALSKLAFQTITKGTHISIEEFLKTMRKNCKQMGLDKEIENKIVDAAIRSNIIQLEGTKCYFRHHSFQEFFAAKELFSLFNDGQKINKRTIGGIAGKKPFLEPLKFLSGLLEDSTELVNLLSGHNRFVAGECIITAKSIDKKTFEMNVKKLIKTVGERNLTNVWYAVDIINRIGSKATALVMQEIEKGTDPDLKRRMYWVAGGISDPGLNEFLVNRVMKETDEHNIVHFLLGLQESSSKERAFIAESFLGHQNPVVGGDAFIALKNHEQVNQRLLKKHGFDLDKLQQKLVSNLDATEFWERMHSILVLGKLKHGEVVEKLVGLLDDKDTSIQWYATLALCQIGDKNTLDLLQKALETQSKNKVVYQKALEAVQGGVTDRKDLAKIWSF